MLLLRLVELLLLALALAVLRAVDDVEPPGQALRGERLQGLRRPERRRLEIAEELG